MKGGEWRKEDEKNIVTWLNTTSLDRGEHVLNLHATCRSLNIACKALVFAELSVRCNSTKFVDLCLWLDQHPAIAAFVIHLRFTGRPRGMPVARRSVKPSMSWSQVTDVLTRLPSLRQVSLTWLSLFHNAANFTTYRSSPPTTLPFGVTKPSTKIFSSMTAAHIPILTFDCVEPHQTAHSCNPRICVANKLRVVRSASALQLLYVHGLASFVCEDIPSRDLHLVAQIVMQNTTSLHTVALTLARGTDVPSTWKSLVFHCCTALHSVAICLPLNIWTSSEHANTLVQCLSGFIAVLPKSLYRLTIELDFLDWYDVVSYTSIIERVQWGVVQEEIATVVGLTELRWIIVHKTSEPSASNSRFATSRSATVAISGVETVCEHLPENGCTPDELITPEKQASTSVEDVAPNSVARRTPATVQDTNNHCGTENSAHLVTEDRYNKFSSKAPNQYPHILRPGNIRISSQTHSETLRPVTYAARAGLADAVDGGAHPLAFLLDNTCKLAGPGRTRLTLASVTSRALEKDGKQRAHSPGYQGEQFSISACELEGAVSNAPLHGGAGHVEGHVHACKQTVMTAHVTEGEAVLWMQKQTVERAYGIVVEYCYTFNRGRSFFSRIHWSAPFTDFRAHNRLNDYALPITTSLKPLASSTHPLHMDSSTPALGFLGDRALSHLVSLTERWRADSTAEETDKELIEELMLGIAALAQFNKTESTTAAMDAARRVVTTGVRKWVHTKWAHDTREYILREHNIDLFNKLIFDFDTEVEKLFQQVRTGQMSTEDFRMQHTRLKQLYNLIPEELRPKPTEATVGASSGITVVPEQAGRANTTTPHNDDGYRTNIIEKKKFAAVYRRYPRYIQDNFSQGDLERAFADEAWPTGPYVKYKRSKGQPMCHECTALPDVAICVYLKEGTQCFQCKIDDKPCTSSLTAVETTLQASNVAGTSANTQGLLKPVDSTISYLTVGASETDEGSDILLAPTTNQASTVISSVVDETGSANTTQLLTAVRHEKSQLRAHLAVLQWELDDMETNEGHDATDA
ncbi:hypothetical protein BDW22DRAFT_1468485 [Trametopsis cervina]|nr:hypothetical protein BDW22DRAFT_1468485 [Trametopsis cervina]